MRTVKLCESTQAIIENNIRWEGQGPGALKSFALACAMPDTLKFKTYPAGVSVPCYARDTVSLNRTLEGLSRMGLRIRRDPVVRMYNLHDNDDILRSPPGCEVLVICRPFISKPFSKPWMNTLADLWRSRVWDGLYKQSPLSLKPESWRRAVVQSGAKIVVNITDVPEKGERSYELPTAWIDHAPFGHMGHITFPMLGVHAVLEYKADFLVRRDWEPGRRLLASSLRLGQPLYSVA